MNSKNIRLLRLVLKISWTYFRLEARCWSNRIVFQGMTLCLFELLHSVVEVHVFNSFFITWVIFLPGSRGSDEAKVSKSGDVDDWKLASLVDSLPLEAAAFDSDDDGGSDSDSSSDSNRDNNGGDGGHGVIIAEKTNAKIVDIGFADSEWTTFSEAGLDYKKTKGIIKWAEGLGVRITVKDLEPTMEGTRMDNRILIPRILNHQFSDGVLISRLVQRLERSNPLPGFEPYPKNAAQRTQNLRRCIEHLARSNKKLTWQSLSFCEDDILQGNLKTTFTLLSDIKVAYTHR